MNLYFRLFLILIKSKLAARIGIYDKSFLSFRVWPFDCDINMHLTNARYFAFCDLGRIYYLAQAGILFKLIKRKWLPIAQAQEISYFRPINPLQSFKVYSRLSHWDEKYWYVEHSFFSAKKLCATVQVRGVFVSGGKLVSMKDVLKLAGDDVVAAMDAPVNVEYWQKLIDVKKASSAQAETSANKES